VSPAAADRQQELTLAGLRAQADMLTRGEVSSRELVESSLSAAERTTSTLNAFRCLRADAARDEADEADRRLHAGERGPLLGVPIAVKDDLDVAGETTAFGCAGRFEVKAADAHAVGRLRQAGAVIVGKTNTPEIGQWPITESTGFGVTRNPWDARLTPGGSSGGSAAAVAAGVVAAALGSDGLGSVRIPAAWTHLVGIKPQRGRISTWPDPESFNGLTCIGPLARTVADAALLLEAATGNHLQDRHRPKAPAETFAAAAEREPPRLRVALSLRIPHAVAPARLDDEVRAATERIASVIEGLGHHVELADPAYGAFGIGAVPRSLAGVRHWASRVPEHSLLDPRTKHNARVGALLGGPVLRVARLLEPAMAWQVGTIFRRFDVILTPTTAKPPLSVGAIDELSGWQTDRKMVAACPYTWPWNVIGWPAMSVPAGFTSAGAPVGAQLVGPEGAETVLISLAAQLEQQERWHEHRPPNSVYAPDRAETEERAR
jgi:amidase